MNEIALYFEDEGRGSPALIFLHYFAGSSRSWTHVVASASMCQDLAAPRLWQASAFIRSRKWLPRRSQA